MLYVLNENTREYLAIEVGKSLRSNDVILALSQLMRVYGKPVFISSDIGTEFTATAVMKWLRDQNVDPAYIKSGRPWQNGFVESFNGKLRDECLNKEWFGRRQEQNWLLRNGGISITMSDRIQLLAIAPRPQLVGSGAKCWRLSRSLTMLVATNFSGSALVLAAPLPARCYSLIRAC